MKRILFLGLLTAGLILIGTHGRAQGNENFTNIPTGSPTAYQNRTWTGTNSVTWTATNARTDQTMTGKAICTNGTGTVTSPPYAGGMGTLQFNYVRGFTGTGSRSIEVWVNGTLVGVAITVDPNSNTIAAYSAAINVGGAVTLELRTSGTQIKIDDIQWTAFVAGPTVNFTTATSSALEDVGVGQTINLTISPAATVASSIIINIAGTSTATYGAANDYTTTPAAIGTNITVTVPVGATGASFTVDMVTDAFTEPNETINLSIVGVTGDLYTGSNVIHTFTILNDDTTPTIEFGTLNASVLEGGAATFSINFYPAVHPSGTVTIQITSSTGATYGVSPNDYTTSVNGSSGTFMIPFGPSGSLLTFSATSYNDGIVEGTDTVTFTIISAMISAGAILIAPNSSANFTISDINSPPTVLIPGDLAIVGVNANTFGCAGALGDDEVSFFCFEDIGYGTTLILTDNGYSRCTPGRWGNTEGTVRMTRTGPTIPKGQVITFRLKNGVSGPGNIVAVAPDASWTCTSIGITGTSVTLNAGGDQIFFMQGGTWGAGTSGAHNATYSGTVLFAFTTNPTFPWSASCGSDGTERSNLPPGVECFSMSPTLASDYNKYIGPITAADQRDWIIRIDDQANWNSYTSCGQYSSSGYNWLTAARLPIIPGTMTNGLWRGAKNTDWFECKNWDDARIPDATTNVVINQTAIRNCQVGISPGISPGGTGICSSLSLTTNGAGHFLMVEPNSTLNITNDLLVERTGGTGVQTFYVRDNATITGRNLNLRSVNPTLDESVYFSGYLNSVSRFIGNVTIEPGGMLNLYSPIPANFGTMYIGGNYTNQRTEPAFEETYSQVIFNGTGAQSINTNSFEERFYNLRVNKASGVLTLNAPIAVLSTLDLLNGQVLSTSANLLTMKAGSTVTGVSNASFVNGPVQKVGNTAFTYPFGKNSLYRPATTTPSGAIATDAFTAEYFNTSPITPLGPTGLNHDATLHHVSACEYWTINRSSGTPNATVTLSWQAPTSCGVTNLPDMRVGYWTGTLWTDAGGNAISGSNAAGTVSTAGVVSTFLQPTNYWTLASLTTENPLPIELLSFTAQPSGSTVALKWTTASERNNDHFTVERSTDAMTFTPLLHVPGAGNSQNVIDYMDTDASPMHGLSYYRLRQTDFDGTTVVSDAVPVFFSSKGQPLQVLYSNDGLFVMHDFAPGSTLEVMDLTGRVVDSTGISADGVVKVPLDGMAHGVYLLRMTDGMRVESTRVAY